MKKFRHFIPFILASAIALAIPLAACDSCGKKEEKTLQSIEVVEAETGFLLGEKFSSDGLVVKATYTKDSSGDVVDEILGDNDYQLDSTAYNENVLGVYPIIVSYSYRNVDKEVTYEVEVVGYKQDGIDVALAEGVEDTYTLSKAQPKIEIDTSKIVVRNINKNGTLGTTITEYTAKLYKGKEEITLTNGKASVGGGAYTIWVEKESDRYPGFMRSGFAVIYVNDSIESFEFKSGDKSQQKGADIISDTWIFEAEYASGETKEIPSSQCEFEIDTMAVGTDKDLAVTYTDYTAKGTAITKTLNIKYTISPKYGETTYTYDYNAIDYSNMEGDQTPLKQSDFKGVNTFLKVGSGTLVYRNKEEWSTGANVIEIKGEGLKVTFDGTGTISIGFCSTGSSNASTLGLKGKDGYVAASLRNINVTENSKIPNTYDVKGTDAYVVTFEITEPGEYSIVGETAGGNSRNTRIHSIVMVDNVPEPAGATLSNVDYSNQTYIVKKVEKV